MNRMGDYKLTKVMVKLLSFTCILAFVSMLFMSPNTALAQKSPRLFGTGEIQSKKLSKFKKWTSVLDRYATEVQSELNKCTLTASNKCLVTKWRIFLKKIADKPPREQMELVNQYMNKWLYVIDPVNYQRKDYWATPKQFLNRNGDCEDYAIAKFASLAHLGFEKDQMRIVVLQDLNLKVPHAVLVVYVDGQALILDNQISKVVNADRIKHYKPIFSINEDAWWLHRG
ncbi:transglutaminase-like cysteine peptidase [Curvivirga sp.]|uniref:transglutaminase-like cysteine peptidase n=1 Tax=Curvivirga sp. TaxID=2856848 RepID=UPI003B59A2BF